MGRRDVGPVRFLLIVNPETKIELDSYREVFVGLTSWASPDNGLVSQIVCDADPHVIISIGASQDSALWRMPLWRRRTWVDIPDAGVQPQAVKMAALSLLGAVIDHNHFEDAPLVSVVPTVERASDVVRIVNELVVKQTHDNVEVLVSDHVWNEVRDAIIDSPGAMVVRPIDSTEGLYPFDIVRVAVGEARGEWIWPVSSSSPAAPSEMLETLVISHLSDKDRDCLIVSALDSLEEILDSVDSGSNSPIEHFLIRRASLASSRIFSESPPFGSLGAVMSLVACETSVQLLAATSTATIDFATFAHEPDDVRRTLLQAPIGFARRINKGRPTAVSG